MDNRESEAAKAMNAANGQNRGTSQLPSIPVSQNVYGPSTTFVNVFQRPGSYYVNLDLNGASGQQRGLPFRPTSSSHTPTPTRFSGGSGTQPSPFVSP